MKIEKLNEDNFIVFLNKMYLKSNKLELKKDIENYFKCLFKKLNEFYNMEMSGYYDIKIYCDKIYGYVLDIKKEEIDLYDYYDDHINMKIEIIDGQKFVFRIHDMSVLDKLILNYCHLLKLKDDLYLLPKKTINQYILGRIIENSSLIYGEISEKIISKAEELKIKQVFV